MSDDEDSFLFEDGGGVLELASDSDFDADKEDVGDLGLHMDEDEDSFMSEDGGGVLELASDSFLSEDG